jgi:hypothetical protein
LKKSVFLGNQDQRFHRSLPLGRVVVGSWQLGDIGPGVPKSDELRHGLIENGAAPAAASS